MSMLGPMAAKERGRARTRRSRRNRFLRWTAGLLFLALVFFAGLAIGRALEQAPRPGGSQTIVRTLEPLTVAPADRTVTVTTSTP